MKLRTSLKKKKKRLFTQKDFKSGDGMVVALWGPAMWHSLHTISFNYPIYPTIQDKKNYKAFITNLTHVLPCKHCRTNLTKNLKLFPMTASVMKNRDSFSRYIYALHERVNTNLNKISGLSYCDVRERYEHFRSRCVKDSTTDNQEKTNKPSQGKSKKQDKNREQNKTKKWNKKGEKEKGCTESLYGKKAKCIIQIVPKEKKCKTFQMDKSCEKIKIE